MKICDLVQFYSPLSGGVKRYIHDKMRLFEHRAEFQHVLIIPAAENDLQLEYGSRVHSIAAPHLPGSKSYRLITSKRRIADIVRAEKPNLIEVGDPYQTAQWAVDIGRRQDIPIIGFYHSDYPRSLGRTIQRFTGKRAALNVTKMTERYLRHLYNRMEVTIAATRRFERILNEAGVKNVVHIPLGCNCSVFHPRPRAKEQVCMELGLSSDTRLLLYVGRLAREKNVMSLLQMMDELHEMRAGPCALLMVGDGEHRARIQAACTERSDAYWMPYCSTGDRLAELYSAADVFVHAGMSETFGLAVLEAQACGTRVVVARESGMLEALNPDESPILADGPTGAEFARAVHEALCTPTTSEGKTSRARSLEQHFSVEVMGERLTSLYKNTLFAASPTPTKTHS